MNAPRYSPPQHASKKHGLRMRGRISKCWLFTYRSPAAVIRQYVPEPLEPVTHKGFGFWNIVACEVSRLRPWPLPSIFGMRYRHVAYRIHVKAPGFRYPGFDEEPEGLYFLRSDCDNGLIGKVGNLMTDLKFNKSAISVPEVGERAMIRIGGAKPAEIELDPMLRPELSWKSPFDSVSEAAAFLQYKPMALSPDGLGGIRAMRIKRNESDWKAKVRGVCYSNWEYLPREVNSGFEICYEVDPIEYDWQRSKDLIRVRSS